MRALSAQFFAENIFYDAGIVLDKWRRQIHQHISQRFVVYPQRKSRFSVHDNPKKLFALDESNLSRSSPKRVNPFAELNTTQVSCCQKDHGEAILGHSFPRVYEYNGSRRSIEMEEGLKNGRHSFGVTEATNTSPYKLKETANYDSGFYNSKGSNAIFGQYDRDLKTQLTNGYMILKRELANYLFTLYIGSIEYAEAQKTYIYIEEVFPFSQR